MLGSIVNKKISALEYCKPCLVSDKYIVPGGYGRASKDILVVEINGENHRLLCSVKYWNKILPGDKINISYNRSKVGFNFITLIH